MSAISPLRNEHLRQRLDAAMAQVNQVLLGKPRQVKLAFACLIAGGHLLLEDIPGVGKTTLAHALAATFALDFQRVQFTSDLLPSDILGVSVYERETGQFRFHPGPIFAGLLLADEINRASPKTQSALLEAMAENQVTVDGQTHALAQPFFVVATQNPLDLNGTFPLPDSQLDRFMLRLSLDYPDTAAERALLTGSDRRDLLDRLTPQLDGAALLALHRQAQKITASAALLDYLQALLAASRRHADIRVGPAQRPHARAAGGYPGAVRAAGRAPPAAGTRCRRPHAGAPVAGRGGRGLIRDLLQRVQTGAERRLPALTRYRRPESLPIELHRRRIYIVPTGFGLGFSVLLLVMLLGALNYANNAALLLTCLLGAASAASMLVAFRSLDGLRLSHARAGHAVAGQPIELTLTFHSHRARRAIRLDAGITSIAFALDENSTTQVALALPTTQRGWQALPRLRLWSSWPLGLFRAWSWLHPDQSILVWPRPEPAGPPPDAPANDARHMQLHQGDEWAALRDYRAGDPQRHIAWKASARHLDLLVKDFERPQGRLQWQLDWRQLDGLANEARIARLARWLDEAQARHGSYSLWLPGEEIASGSGPLHYARCMNALAQLP